MSKYHSCLQLIYDILIRHGCPLTTKPELCRENTLALFPVLSVQNTIRKSRKKLTVKNVASAIEPELDAASWTLI